MANSLESRLSLLVLLSALCLAHCSRSNTSSQSCRPSGYIHRPAGRCYTTDPNCCQPGKSYPQYLCSPPVTRNTSAAMTLGIFSGNIDYGPDGPTGCDGRYHSDSELIVALSTGWYDRGRRCLMNIKINANGRSVVAKVFDECDSVNGCDADHDYLKPCANNVVDASRAVWEALGIPKSQIRGTLDITWSDE